MPAYVNKIKIIKKERPWIGPAEPIHIAHRAHRRPATSGRIWPHATRSMRLPPSEGARTCAIAGATVCASAFAGSIGSEQPTTVGAARAANRHRGMRIPVPGEPLRAPPQGEPLHTPRPIRNPAVASDQLAAASSCRISPAARRNNARPRERRCRGCVRSATGAT